MNAIVTTKSQLPTAQPPRRFKVCRLMEHYLGDVDRVSEAFDTRFAALKGQNMGSFYFPALDQPHCSREQACAVLATIPEAEVLEAEKQAIIAALAVPADLLTQTLILGTMLDGYLSSPKEGVIDYVDALLYCLTQAKPTPDERDEGMPTTVSAAALAATVRTAWMSSGRFAPSLGDFIVSYREQRKQIWRRVRWAGIFAQARIGAADRLKKLALADQRKAERAGLNAITHPSPNHQARQAH